MFKFCKLYSLVFLFLCRYYKPFGKDANATGTEKYAFTGQYSEADIGLYYFS